MEYKKKGLIGIIVGLEREKKIIPKKNNIIVKNAYGKNSYHAANKLIRPLASYKGNKYRKVVQLSQR